ncbi:MAG: hypothetical protein QOJ99_2127 [Bryobacterales bacterium]|jgi:hypothetical protein|nr:hypothetical protein [Bryobacterales bacterium]
MHSSHLNNTPTLSLPSIGTLALYSAYGLNIESELPLPEFSAVDGGPFSADVTISFGDGEDWIGPLRQEPSSWKVDRLDARFWFNGVAGFRIKAGREITISPEPGIDNSLLRMYVEGMMMATLLFQRGYFVLHSSVVCLNGLAVAFLGHVGAGKSSTAAALHARGHAVVADDNAAIDLEAGQLAVTPAFPFLKVFPAIADALGFADDSLTQMHFSQPKSVRPFRDSFPVEPVPLSRIYVLTREPIQSIERLGNSEAVIELIRNSVPTRWKQPGGAAHLQACALLAARFPVYRIRTFDTLPEIPELAARIEQHCA